MTSETKKIILVDAIAIAAVALLVAYPNIVGGIIICSLLLPAIAFWLFLPVANSEGRKAIAKTFLIGEGGAILGRISRGEKIL